MMAPFNGAFSPKVVVLPSSSIPVEVKPIHPTTTKTPAQKFCLQASIICFFVALMIIREGSLIVSWLMMLACVVLSVGWWSFESPKSTGPKILSRVLADLGFALNLTAMASNQFAMPVGGLPCTGSRLHRCMEMSAMKVPYLCDIWAGCSVGDMLIGMGLVLMFLNRYDWKGSK